MNIVIFVNSYLPVIGGVAQVIRNLARIFKERGHSTLIITSKEGLDLPCRENIEGVEVLRYDFPLWSRHPSDVIRFLSSLPITLCRLREVLNRNQPNVINVHVIHRYSVYPLLLSYLVRFPFVASVHGADVVDYPYESLLDHKISLAWLERAMFVTTNSRWLLDRAQEISPAIADKSLTLGNGVNLEEFDNRATFRYPKPYVLSVGRFFSRKGFDLLIKAFGLVSKQINDLDLIIAGDGPERMRYAQLINELGLQERVHLLGYTDRRTTVSLFHGCELVVLPSRYEAFGIVLLEAMAAKKAIVATQVGGVPEIVKDGSNGILVQAEDIEGLAKGIACLHTNADLRIIMGERSRKMVEERYTWEQIADRYLEVYQKVINDAK